MIHSVLQGADEVISHLFCAFCFVETTANRLISSTQRSIILAFLQILRSVLEPVGPRVLLTYLQRLCGIKPHVE
jgi:hypothetical protein